MDDKTRTILTIISGAAVFCAGLAFQHMADKETYTALALFLISYAILGGKIILHAITNIFLGKVFDENFLIGVATIGAFIVGEYPEAVAVMLFYQVGELFQDMAIHRSRQSIVDLMDIRPDYANVLVNGTVSKTNPESVRVGDTIVVKPGERIPLDGVVAAGSSMLDMRALTGESAPKRISVHEAALSGCINLNGVLEIEVTKPFRESTAERIIGLVESARCKKAAAENFITYFARYYTPVVVGLAVMVAVIPPLLALGAWADWVHRGLIFLVVSCPCALVVSIPLGFYCGIGSASKKGILVKGGNYLDALNGLETVVFDKTGTLTKGAFNVASVKPSDGFSADMLLELAAKAEALSNHPIALSILRAYGNKIDSAALFGYEEISGRGVMVRSNGQTIVAGNHILMNQMGIKCNEAQSTGTKVYVAADNAFAGHILIADEIKQDSKMAIAALKANGVKKTVMLTGDNNDVAQYVAAELGIDEFHGGLLPGQKVEMVERLIGQKSRKGKLAFVGDGINDAPVLARADIGIAMGGLGSDAAIEAADVVLMTDEPIKIVQAIDIARFTKRKVWQNIVFALSIKAAILLLSALGLANMWEAVFADVGVALLAVLNASRVGGR